MADYIPTIGIETHVQLKSKTKLFAAVGNDARNAAPNTLISHICVGMPGALPVLNEGALKLAARAAFALGTKPQKFSHFDRKHYFYPDLPKGYQITQYQNPIIIGGQVEINVDGAARTINITRAHLEEDAGKTTHPDGADYSLVDLNRAGTPLLEIVSEPEIHTAAEAKAYARELYLLMKYADVSDADLYHGNMRFDVNISISAEDGKFGKRAEVKNLNSFKSVEAAVEYEIKRQAELIDKGEEVIQETRGWDEAKQKTTAQRGKEEAHDYRYFPDPDIPPIELSDEYINKVEKDVPTLPPKYRLKLDELAIDKNVIEDLLERPLSLEKIIQVIERSNANYARRAAFFLITTSDGSWTPSPESLIAICQMIDGGEISTSAAKQVYDSMSENNEDAKRIATSLDVIQISDEGEIDIIVAEVIAENPKAAEDVKNGEMKAIGFLVGQVMAKSKGQANPGLAQDLLKKHLEVKE